MNKYIVQFKEALENAAKQLDVTPQNITRDDLITLGIYKNKREILALGGFGKLKDMLFPDSIDPELVKALAATKLIKTQKNRYNTILGKSLLSQDEVADNVADLVKKAGFKLHKPIKVVKAKGKKNRTIVAHVSDTHMGCNIKPDEMGNTNEFNWTIAARRFALFAKQIAEYKPQHRKDTDLVILLNGDIIAGVIHDQEWFADLLAIQQVGAIKTLGQFITYLATQFSNVKVVCTFGNHERSMHKSSQQRAMTHKFDSYMAPVYVALRAMLASHKNVSFDIPKSPYAIVEIQGHLTFVTHGDSVINVGNPGKSVNIESINKQINKLNSSGIGGDRSFDIIATGHVHHNCAHLMESGAMLVINGTLSGGDPYAQSAGFFNTQASQQLFEVTPEHAVGDLRMIRLEGADNDKSLDSIIEAYDGESL